ncbi:glycosyltransferase [Actomonas aquatica]|uniref:Glycosyltransferase n=1 Tax=Actomonas aquatica TaxID=2866162 RepID=A0ABZ1C9Y9_9BACT|nr:glycosyltransferase [Opitutus sp. WL0086]WRQ88498.1 glycosyltransferase [Opitutus sp. WL0086]
MSVAPPEIAHGLETPYPLQPCQNYFRLEGWALLRGGAAPTIARIRIGDTTHAPESTSRRDDVQSLYPEDEFAANTGFLFVIYLPFGNHLATLEASNDGGDTWHPVRSMMVPVSSHPLMGAFEPAGTNGLITETCRPTGWVWHPEFEIAHIELLFGNMALPVETGLERPDVAERFPDQPGARYSGFLLAENLPRGKGPIRLHVTTSCGRTYFLDPAYSAKLPNGAYAPPRPPPDMWELPPVDRAGTGASTPLPAAPDPAGPHNVLFVLYGDFTSNSAAHVCALADELIGHGYDCIVAVPEHAETIGAQGRTRFLAIEYPDLPNLASYYRDSRGPAVIHAWTTRERVRLFCAEAQTRFDCDLILHLEDNERELLANHLNCSLEELETLPAEDLDQRVPLDLTHPLRASQFMASAQGITVIIDRLREFVPADVPSTEIWPAALPTFAPRPLDHTFRRTLGIADSDTVLFYHGNAHASNAPEMLELHRAVLQLNEAGHRTWLLRTGRNSPDFERLLPPAVRPHLIHLGFVKRHRDLPRFMAMADVFVQPGQAGSFNDYRFPSKLPEFFALGRPVILPRSNLGHTVQHLRDAYVLEDANAATIAAAVMELTASPELTASLSQGAIAFGQKHFSWPRSAQRLIDFLLQHTRLKAPDDARQRAARAVSAAAAD